MRRKSLKEFAEAQAASQPDAFNPEAEAVARKPFLLRPLNIAIAVVLLIGLAVGGYFIWAEASKTPAERMTESLTKNGVTLNSKYTPDMIIKQCNATEQQIGSIVQTLTPPDKITIVGIFKGKESLVELVCDHDTKNTIKSASEATGSTKTK